MQEKLQKLYDLLSIQSGEKKIQLLIELAIWYLHQPGQYKKDLDSAVKFTHAASILANAGKFINWQNECKFLNGELYFQQGRPDEGEKAFLQMITPGLNSANAEVTAHAYELLGLLLPNTDSIKLVYYQKSLEIYKQLQFKEKEIDLLGDIISRHIHVDGYLAETDAFKILALQQANGFRHTMYVQNLLAYFLIQKSDYLGGLQYANAAVDNMEWSGLKVIAGAFYTRVGMAYANLGKKEEGFLWWKKQLKPERQITIYFGTSHCFMVAHL